MRLSQCGDGPNAGLFPDHDAIPDYSTACDTHLAANNAISPKPDIVRNLHEVIENSPRSDYGVTGRTWSTAQFAPISTSSSIMTRPSCGMRNRPFAVGTKPKPCPPLLTGRDLDSAPMMA